MTQGLASFERGQNEQVLDLPRFQAATALGKGRRVGCVHGAPAAALCSSQRPSGKLSAGNRAGWPGAEGWGSMWSQDKWALVLWKVLAATFINNEEGGRRL